MRSALKYSILPVAAVALLSSCAKTSTLRKTAALQSVTPALNQPLSKLGQGVYVLTERRTRKYGSKGRGFAYTMQAADATMQSGYNYFVLFPYKDNDSELSSAIKNKTVRQLYLQRLKKNSKVVKQLSVVHKIARRHFAGPNKKSAIRAVVVMFKNKKIGFNAQKTKRKIKKWIGFLSLER